MNGTMTSLFGVCHNYSVHLHGATDSSVSNFTDFFSALKKENKGTECQTVKNF